MHDNLGGDTLQIERKYQNRHDNKSAADAQEAGEDADKGADAAIDQKR